MQKRRNKLNRYAIDKIEILKIADDGSETVYTKYEDFYCDKNSKEFICSKPMKFKGKDLNAFVSKMFLDALEKYNTDEIGILRATHNVYSIYCINLLNKKYEKDGEVYYKPNSWMYSIVFENKVYKDFFAQNLKEGDVLYLSKPIKVA